MKKPLIPLILILFFAFTVSARAFENNFFEETYREQAKITGANKVEDAVPKEAQNHINNIGINPAEQATLLKLDANKIFEEILSVGKEKALSPFSASVSAISVILLCAVLQNLKSSKNKSRLEKIIGALGSLCICTAVIPPLTKCIGSAALAIKSASGFTLCAVPVLSGIMIASGKPVSASSYHALIIGAGQVISHMAGSVIVPVMNSLLGISLISSVSCELNLENLCKAIYKSAKFILKFSASVFTGILALQNVVACSADSLGSDAAKFAIDACVPIVGGALSDAFGTVGGCIKLLKSGVGAFAIIAQGAIFLPVIAQCALWIIFLSLTSGISDVFKLKKISAFLKSAENVMQVMLAAVLCVMMILTVSVGVMALAGR